MLSGFIGSRDSLIAYQTDCLTSSALELRKARVKIEEIEEELRIVKRVRDSERALRESMESRLAEVMLDHARLDRRLEAVKSALVESG